MPLTIEVISYNDEPLSAPHSVTFDEAGGTLGRSSDNNLVLTDEEKVVSTIHGIVEYENGAYYYTDNSLNGTFISNRDQWVRHEKIHLNDNDQLHIGDYHLAVSIEGDSSDPLDMAFENEPKSLIDTDDEPTLAPHGFEEDSSPFHLFEPNQQKTSPLNPAEDFESENFLDPNNNFYNASDHFIDGNPKNRLGGFPEQNPTLIIKDNLAINENFNPPKPMRQDDKKNVLPEDLTLDDFFDDEKSAAGVFSPSADENRLHSFAPKPPEQAKPQPHNHGKGSRSAPPEKGKPSDLLSGILNRAKEGRPAIPRPFEKPNLNGSLSRKKEEKSRTDFRPFSNTNASMSPDQLIDIFFKAAGLENHGTIPADDIPDLMHTLGSVLREFISGMITILRGRTELKSQLRVSVTTFKATENNPLKFSPTTESAIKTYLLEKNPGFQDAVESIREGFDDIKNHELAVNAGVQVSLLNILKQFDPESFSRKIEDKYVVFKKARCWDEYRQAYHELFEKAIDDFFGKEFVRAYEEQMEKLRPKSR